MVINKPPGMPVQVSFNYLLSTTFIQYCFTYLNRKRIIQQGGIGVKRSLDELAAAYLRCNDSEFPRLVS